MLSYKYDSTAIVLKLLGLDSVLDAPPDIVLCGIDLLLLTSSRGISGWCSFGYGVSMKQLPFCGIGCTTQDLRVTRYSEQQSASSTFRDCWMDMLISMGRLQFFSIAIRIGLLYIVLL